jgi:large-conductance mechanosensitive channel
MLSDFKKFVLRGSVDLAVAVVVECLSDIPIAARRCALHI